jgi:formylglycine-generating enzyme required for sulfatase activity
MKTVLKLLRGGSWIINPRSCRSAFRDLHLPVIRFYTIGFRVCCLSTVKQDDLL